MNQSRAVMGAKHALLILDDDSAVRASLKFYLEIEGFEVRTYSSAHELLNEDSLPASSCLVADYHMPTMNGLEVVAQLRDRHILNPAILVTSHPNENLRNRADAAGISIVEKPLLGGLLDSIRKAFDGHTKPSYRPFFRRQRSRAERPHRGVRQDTGHIGQRERADAGTQICVADANIS
jgi:FixJ family two-component response regulator